MSMGSPKMHSDEIDISPDLVGRLLASQFPEWAGLPVLPVASSGTDNALFRVGSDLVARLPRIHWAIKDVDKEHEWLPRLAPRLPLAIPTPLARGTPAEEYPWSWSIYRWLDGGNGIVHEVADLNQTAVDLAHFIGALQQIDPRNGPRPDPYGSERGVALVNRDAETREAIAGAGELLDADAVIAAWDAALRTPEWADSPTWIHGDLQAGNMLFVNGRLSAVIDFGCLGVGDPACDLMPAWSFFTGESRNAFRRSLDVDDATWARGRGWALSVALIALPYYLHSNPAIVRASRRTIAEVLADGEDW
jgi:aminoglycoside phosphotransferase (APT) family kinase protein